MFSFEFCEILENTYFEEHLRTAAFVLSFSFNNLKVLEKVVSEKINFQPKGWFSTQNNSKAP